MLADGTLERPDLLHITTSTSTTPPGRAFGAASLETLYNYIEEGLKYYQGWYYPHVLNPWVGYMPFAWYLRQGAKLRNLEHGDLYTIVKVERDKGKSTGRVQLSGNVPPKKTDRLVFVRDRHEVLFMHAFPKTFSTTYEVKSGEDDLYPHPWRDAVTFYVDREEPGTLEGQPFMGTRDLKRKHREYGNLAGYSHYGTETRGQWYDSIVQFDCWAKTNYTAERLLEWFKSFMSVFNPVFEANGVPQVIFWARKSDGMTTRWRDDIVYRSCTYYVRTETVTTVLQRKINNINILAGLPGGTGEPFPSGWAPHATGIDGSIPAEIYET